MFLNGVTRREIGTGRGDSVTIEVRFDPSDRRLQLSNDPEAALDEADHDELGK